MQQTFALRSIVLLFFVCFGCQCSPGRRDLLKSCPGGRPCQTAVCRGFWPASGNHEATATWCAPIRLYRCWRQPMEEHGDIQPQGNTPETGTETREISGLTAFDSASVCNVVNVVLP